MLRALFTVSGLTLLSRVLGLVRDVMIAKYIGAGPVNDTWVAAFRFPNLFRRVFGEGAFNAAFVPRYCKKLEADGEAAADEFASRTLVLVGIILTIISLVAFAAMGPITRLLASGFEGETFERAVELSRITVGYLVFVCLMAAVTGVLNSRKIFGAPAFAYVAMNIVFIASLLIYGPKSDQPVYVLAYAVLVAGVVQLAIVVISAFRNGIQIKLASPKLDADTKALGILMVPGIVTAAVQQLNLIVGQTVASHQPGGMSYIYYSDRLNQFPLGLIGMAFGTVLLPSISRHLNAGREVEAKATLARGLEMSFLLSIPAMVALVVLSDELIFATFKAGAFSLEDVRQTGLALMAFAIGGPAYIVGRVLTQGFFAQEDTKTPMKFTFVSAAVNIVFCIVLFIYLRHIGCALATSIAGWVHFALLWLGLKKRGLLKLEPGFFSRLGRMLFCAAVMGGAVWWIADFFSDRLFADGRLTRLLFLTIVSVLGATVYFVLVFATRLTSLREIKSMLRKQ